jgi:uncharacterized membrane protein YgcG
MGRVFVILGLFTLLAGCNKPLTDPEAIDPIYKDLLSEYSNAQKDVLEKQKSLEEAEAKLKEIVPQTGQTRKQYNHYYDAKNKLLLSKQKENYLRVRSNSRKFEARRLYLDAFEQGKPWPNPQEYELYQKDKQAKAKSRNWRDRTPAYDAIKSKKEGEKKNAKSGGEHGSGGGEAQSGGEHGGGGDHH